MKKNWTVILPIIAIFIAATLPGDDFLSVSYIIKSALIFIFLISSIIGLIRQRRNNDKKRGSI